MKRRKGHEIDYAGKKYVSLHELCDDLDLPYSPLAHKYYRTKDIEQSVERAKKVKDAQTYIVWGREYKSLTALFFYYCKSLSKCKEPCAPPCRKTKKSRAAAKQNAARERR